MLADAEAVMRAHGLRVSPRRLRRIVNRFVTERQAGQDFRAWFLGYSDPTGEQAVRNVMRGQR
jgi:hypothetical protein